MQNYARVLQKIDHRIQTLKEHGGPTEKVYDNQYAELMDAVARIVGVALLKELEDVRKIIVEECCEKCE